MATFIITKLTIDCVYRHERKSLPYIGLISIDRLLVLGAFLWDDPDEIPPDIPYRDLRLKLKSQANFNEFSFKITSASTCNFRKDDFVYT